MDPDSPEFLAPLSLVMEFLHVGQNQNRRRKIRLPSSQAQAFSASLLLQLLVPLVSLATSLASSSRTCCTQVSSQEQRGLEVPPSSLAPGRQRMGRLLLAASLVLEA